MRITIQEILSDIAAGQTADLEALPCNGPGEISSGILAEKLGIAQSTAAKRLEAARRKGLLVPAMVSHTSIWNITKAVPGYRVADRPADGPGDGP